MANLKVLDGDGSDKYIASTGAGSDGDPHVNIHEVTQSTHNDLNANANIQVGDTDVSETNPVPVANGISAWQTFSIANGADGSAVTPADLGANYKAILVRCEDCQYIQASTTMGIELSEGAADTMCDMYEANDPGTIWASSDLPTTGTLRAVITHGFMARRVRIVLSQNSSGGATVFSIAGSDRGI